MTCRFIWYFFAQTALPCRNWPTPKKSPPYYQTLTVRIKRWQHSLDPQSKATPPKKEVCSVLCPLFSKKNYQNSKIIQKSRPNHCSPQPSALEKKKKKHPKKNEPLGFFSMWDRSTCEFHPQTPLRESPTNKPPSRLFVWPLHPAIVANEGFV